MLLPHLHSFFRFLIGLVMLTGSWYRCPFLIGISIVLVVLAVIISDVKFLRDASSCFSVVIFEIWE